MAKKKSRRTVRRAPRARAARLSPDERRSQLLACAMRVFSDHGLAKANHLMVARAAKVSEPTVFAYFKTNEALVDAVLGEIERFYADIFSSAAHFRGSALDALSELTRALNHTLDVSLGGADYNRIMRDWSVAFRSPIWPRYLRLYGRMKRVFRDIIVRGQREGAFRADVDPDAEAEILNAVSSTLFQLMETGAGPAQAERFRRAVIGTLLISNDRASAMAATDKS